MQTLTYNQHPIAIRGEMLNLTDMWKAAGGDPARQPSNWLSSADAQRFIDVLAEIHNPGNSGIIERKRGKGGSTVAHWQIGLAYAKYLSPDFHIWCNTVVRERMERRVESAGMGVTDLVQWLDGRLEEIVTAKLAAADRVVTTDFKPARFVLDQMKLKPSERRGLSTPVCKQLQRYSARNPKYPAPRECPITGRYMFHCDLIRDWLGEGGGALFVAECIARRRSKLGAPDLFVISHNGKRRPRTDGGPDAS